MKAVVCTKLGDPNLLEIKEIEKYTEKAIDERKSAQNEGHRIARKQQNRQRGEHHYRKKIDNQIG